MKKYTGVRIDDGNLWPVRNLGHFIIGMPKNYDDKPRVFMLGIPPDDGQDIPIVMFVEEHETIMDGLQSLTRYRFYHEHDDSYIFVTEPISEKNRRIELVDKIKLGNNIPIAPDE